VTGDADPAGLDVARVLARAREAQRRAELLHDLARETVIQAMIAQVRADDVRLSPVVEARLQLLLGRPTGPEGDDRAAEAVASSVVVLEVIVQEPPVLPG
jgi:hypothetical protein